MTDGFPGPDDLREAARLLGTRVRRTPLLLSERLSAPGRAVYLKCENLQRGGSFKVRGAFAFLLPRLDEARARGVCTYSSGNHGRAVALAARDLGLRTTVFVPVDVVAAKRRAIVALGAEVREAGRTSKERRRAALEWADRRGALVVPPFDHPDIVRGQGTAILEVLDALGGSSALRSVFVPVGGGGLAGGTAAALGAFAPQATVVAVEPADRPALARALAAGRPVEVPASTSIADGLRPTRVGVEPLRILLEAHRRGRLRVRAVSDERIARAQRALAVAERLVVEPSGAASYAAAVEETAGDGAAVVLLSGGNVDPAVLARHLRRARG